MLSFFAEFIAVPICYIVSALLLLLLALLIYLYFFSEDPDIKEVIQRPSESQQSSTQVPPKKKQLITIKEAAEDSFSRPWTTPLKQLKEAVISKVEYRLQPETGLKELQLDIQTTDQQDVVIHVSPEYKISRCPDLFHFHSISQFFHLAKFSRIMLN